MKVTETFKNTFEQYSDTEQELIRHGMNIIFLDGSEILSVFLLSLVFHLVPETLIYVILFSSLRICCGGYHCSSERNCYLLYILMYLLFVSYVKLNLSGNIIVLLTGSLFLLAKAPLQHVLNPLSKEEFTVNRRKTIWRTVLGVVLYVFIPFTRTAVMFAVFYHFGKSTTPDLLDQTWYSCQNDRDSSFPAVPPGESLCHTGVSGR